MSLNERIKKNSIKRILKKFPQYKCVDNIYEADLAAEYNVDNINRFQIILLNPCDREKIKNNTNEKLSFIYLRHKNNRNRRQIIINDIDKNHFLLQK